MDASQRSFPQASETTPSPNPTGSESQWKGCKCTRTSCLSLYCQCLANSRTCTDKCLCLSCHNDGNHPSSVAAAINTIRERDPYAFFDKVQVIHTPGKGAERRHIKGCRCKKSRCLKKYCVCFKAGVKCSELCKCVGCCNINIVTDTVAERKEELNAERVNNASVHSPIQSPQEQQSFVHVNHLRPVRRILFPKPTDLEMPLDASVQAIEQNLYNTREQYKDVVHNDSSFKELGILSGHSPDKCRLSPETFRCGQPEVRNDGRSDRKTGSSDENHILRMSIGQGDANSLRNSIQYIPVSSIVEDVNSLGENANGDRNVLNPGVISEASSYDSEGKPVEVGDRSTHQLEQTFGHSLETFETLLDRLATSCEGILPENWDLEELLERPENDDREEAEEICSSLAEQFTESGS